MVTCQQSSVTSHHFFKNVGGEEWELARGVGAAYTFRYVGVVVAPRSRSKIRTFDTP